MKNLILVFLYLHSLIASAGTVRINNDQVFNKVQYWKNYVVNPSIDKNDQSITDSSGIASRTTSTILEGDASLLIDGTNSSQSVIFTASNLDNTVYGRTCEFSFLYKGDATLYKAYTAAGGAAITPNGSTDFLTNSTNTSRFVVNFPCGTGATAITGVIESTSASAAAIYVDQVYIGEATNIAGGNYIGDWIDYGAVTITSTGGGVAKGASPAVDKIRGRRIGSHMHFQVDYRTTSAGTIGSGDYLFGIPTASGCTIDSSRLLFNDAVIGEGAQDYGGTVGIASGGRPGTMAGKGRVTAYNSTNVRIFLDTGSSSNHRPVGATIPHFAFDIPMGYSMDFSVPCVGWSAGTTVRLDQTQVMGSLKYVGVANCEWATTSASYANFAADTDCNTPTVKGAASAPSTKIPGLVMARITPGKYKVTVQGSLLGRSSASQTCGYTISDGTSTSGTVRLYANATDIYDSTIQGIFEYTASQSSVTFQVQGYREAGSTNCSIANVNSSMGFEMTVEPIWPTMQVPLVAGGFASSFQGVVKIETARISNTGAAACTVVNTAGGASWLSGNTNLNAGSCDLTIAAGTWSAAPWMCFCNSDLDYGSQKYQCNTIIVSSSAMKTHVATGAGTDTDRVHDIMCIGPR